MCAAAAAACVCVCVLRACMDFCYYVARLSQHTCISSMSYQTIKHGRQVHA